MYIFNRHSRALAECSAHSLTCVHIWLSVIRDVNGLKVECDSLWFLFGLENWRWRSNDRARWEPSAKQHLQSTRYVLQVDLDQKQKNQNKTSPPTMLWGSFRDESGIAKEPRVKVFKGWRKCFHKFHLATATVSKEDGWTAARISSLTQETAMLLFIYIFRLKFMRAANSRLHGSLN